MQSVKQQKKAEEMFTQLRSTKNNMNSFFVHGLYVLQQTIQTEIWQWVRNYYTLTAVKALEEIFTQIKIYKKQIFFQVY